MRALREVFSCAAVVAFALLGAACLDETEKANKNFTEANDLLKEVVPLEAAAMAAVKSGDHATCNARLDDAIKKVDTAARLTKEASGMKVSRVFSEYLDIKSQQFAKHAQIVAKEKAWCAPTADLAALKVERDALAEEYKALSERAEKIEKENKDRFKQ